MESDLSNAILLGRISAVYGIRGWIKVVSYTDPRENIFDYPAWWLSRDGADPQAATLLSGRRQGKVLVAELDGLTDRDAAEALIGTDIYVPRDALPATADQEYYWSDLEGMRVVRDTGVVLGKVASLIETGANDVLVVRGEQERLIPFVLDTVIKEVDLAEGVITVDWEWD